MIYNVYCDESGHLEHDHLRVMVLGAVWCPLEKAAEIAGRLREIKIKHGLPASFEVKWAKVSPGKLSFYADVLNYFFDDDDLHFRALVGHGSFCAWKYGDSSRDENRKFTLDSTVETASAVPELSPGF